MVAVVGSSSVSMGSSRVVIRCWCKLEATAAGPGGNDDESQVVPL